MQIAVLNLLLPAIDELQVKTAELFHRPDALWLSVLDQERAVVTITAVWVVVQGVSPGNLDWPRLSFVLVVSSICGAVSLDSGRGGAQTKLASLASYRVRG